MKRMTAFMPAMMLVIGFGSGSLPIAGGRAPEPRVHRQAIHVGWEESDRGELQAPRVMMREGAPQAPRAHEVQAPRGEDVQAPRAAEIQPPRWRED